MVALREIPAWQCSSTREPVFRASSAKYQGEKVRFSRLIKMVKSLLLEKYATIQLGALNDYELLSYHRTPLLDDFFSSYCDVRNLIIKYKYYIFP